MRGKRGDGGAEDDENDTRKGKGGQNITRDGSKSKEEFKIGEQRGNEREGGGGELKKEEESGGRDAA